MARGKRTRPPPAAHADEGRRTRPRAAAAPLASAGDSAGGSASAASSAGGLEATLHRLCELPISQQVHRLHALDAKALAQLSPAEIVAVLDEAARCAENADRLAQAVHRTQKAAIGALRGHHRE